MMKLIFHVNYCYLTHKSQKFANGSSANVKFSKTQLSKMIQSGGFLSLVPIWDSSDPAFKRTLSSAKSLANSYAKELKILK